MAMALLIPTLIFGMKSLFMPMIQVTLYYTLFRLFMAYGGTIANWAMSLISSNIDLSETTIQLSGVAAWVAEVMMLGQTVSFLMSFLVTRFIIGLVKR
jgi:hypothetical protein